MSAYKLHHTKFYTRHSTNEFGHPHCYRCDEILANDNRVYVAMTPSGFQLKASGNMVEDGEDEGYEIKPTDVVIMGAFCALRAIAGF